MIRSSCIRKLSVLVFFTLVQKYCKGNKGTLAKFDVVFWLYTESADDRKPLLVNLQLLVVALFLLSWLKGSIMLADYSIC